MATAKKASGKALSRIDSKNQITIPVEVLRDSGLAPGDVLAAISDGTGALRLVKVSDPVEELAGVLTHVYSETYLEELRSEWD